uniref:Ig-like domain-containing protein n=1 Tax=Dicentrarchus labrax TaxID=13489 RepID=A0A8C4DTI6_DICLA
QGQSRLIGPLQSILAGVGDDIILPCHLQPAVDVTAETVEWKRSDLKHIFIHVWRAGQDLIKERNPSYKGRTSLFINELKHGNISLKLSKVQRSDQGTYECDLPLLQKQSSVRLVLVSRTEVLMTSILSSNRRRPTRSERHTSIFLVNIYLYIFFYEGITGIVLNS